MTGQVSKIGLIQSHSHPSILRLLSVNSSPLYQKWPTGKEAPTEHRNRLGRILPQCIPTFAIDIGNIVINYFFTGPFSSFSSHLSPLLEARLYFICGASFISTHFSAISSTIPYEKLRKSHGKVKPPFRGGSPTPRWMLVSPSNRISNEAKRGSHTLSRKRMSLKSQSRWCCSTLVIFVSYISFILDLRLPANPLNSVIGATGSGKTSVRLSRPDSKSPRAHCVRPMIPVHQSR